MAVSSYSTVPVSNSVIATINIAEGCPPGNVNDALRQIMADVRQEFGEATTISASSSLDLGTSFGMVPLTGTASTSAFGTVAAGTVRLIRALSSTTLMHDATKLILPGATNILLRSGDFARFISLGSGNWALTDILRGDGRYFVPSGTAGAPAVAHYGDADTGLYFPADDITALSSAGVERLRTVSTGVQITGVLGIGVTPTLSNVAALDLSSGSAAAPVTIDCRESDHATSNRAAVRFGNWQIGQDSGESGTRDLFLYDAGAGAFRLYCNTSGDFGIGEAPVLGYRFRVSDTDTGFSIYGKQDGATGGNGAVIGQATHASFNGNIIQSQAEKAANTDHSHFRAFSSGGADTEFNLRGDGNAFADGSWSGSGADYAECFEWEDGNPNFEDRRGMTVVLSGLFIRPSKPSDSPEDILGVISANPTVVGNSGWNHWKGKFKRDKYGAYELDSKGQRKRVPEFDPAIPYVPRHKRREWAAVGLMGQMWVNNGQTVGARWRLMAADDEVSLWMVR